MSDEFFLGLMLGIGIGFILWGPSAASSSSSSILWDILSDLIGSTLGTLD